LIFKFILRIFATIASLLARHRASSYSLARLLQSFIKVTFESQVLKLKTQVNNMKHLILYDGTCPLCNRAISFILRADKKEVFLFAPLSGTTAKDIFQEHTVFRTDLDSLILVENYSTARKKIMVEGRAALRILWLLGGRYCFVGILSFLPSQLFDLGYRFVAKRRYTLFTSAKRVSPDDFRERFLP